MTIAETILKGRSGDSVKVNGADLPDGLQGSRAVYYGARPAGKTLITA